MKYSTRKFEQNFAFIFRVKKLFKIVFTYFQIKFYENSHMNSIKNKHNHLHQKGLDKNFQDIMLRSPQNKFCNSKKRIRLYGNWRT